MRAAKSVSVLSSTIAPVLPSTTRPTSPSAATRLVFADAFDASAARRRSTAASKSPCVSTSAFLQAITPAPVFSRRVFTSVLLIPAMSMLRPYGSRRALMNFSRGAVVAMLPIRITLRRARSGS